MHNGSQTQGYGTAARLSLSELEARRAEQEQERQQRECERKLGEALRDLAGKLDERYSPERVKLENAERYDPAQARVLDRMLALAQDLSAIVKAGRNIVWFGSVGTGKDHFMAGLLYQAVRAGFSASWEAGLGLYTQFREGDAMPMCRLTSHIILAISDPLPPAADLTPWRIEVLSRIVDARYRALQPIWITMNVRDEAQASEMLSLPVWDRLRHNAEVVPCFWPSFRQR